MYVGQRRFQDVCDLLDGAGFDFVRFLAIGETSVRAPLGFRGDGYQDFADALFLRRSHRVPRDDPRRREMLTKLCLFALTFGVIKSAVHCLTALHGATLPKARAYERFVAACRCSPPSCRRIASPTIPPRRVSSNGPKYLKACAAKMPLTCVNSSGTSGWPTANSRRCCAAMASLTSRRR